MSGNGRGNMRPASRSPPFLLVGLLVALCILAFNYWNLSGKNAALARQLDSVKEDFRSVSNKHLTLEKRTADLTAQLTEKGNQALQFEREKSEKEAALGELRSQVESHKTQQAAFEGQLKDCQNQAESLKQEKQQASDELQKVKTELETVKQMPAPTCNLLSVKDQVRGMVSALTAGLGVQPVADALKKGNFDLSEVAGDLLEGKAGDQASAGGKLQQDPAAAAGSDQQQQVEMQDPNVVQMQQMGGARAVPQLSVGGFGSVGYARDGNSLLVGQQQVQTQGQQPSNVVYNLPGAAGLDRPHDGALEVNGGQQQQIVAQNLPQPAVVDDGANNNPAQEDANAAEVSDDDIDKQAVANQQNAEQLGEGSLQDHLQDLSSNNNINNNAPIVDHLDGKDSEMIDTDKNQKDGDDNYEEEQDNMMELSQSFWRDPFGRFPQEQALNGLVDIKDDRAAGRVTQMMAGVRGPFGQAVTGMRRFPTQGSGLLKQISSEQIPLQTGRGTTGKVMYTDTTRQMPEYEEEEEGRDQVFAQNGWNGW